MISVNQPRESLLVSDRVFRPDSVRGLSADWDDPIGANAPNPILLEHHHKLRVLLESSPHRCIPASDALRRRSYRVALYHGLGTSESIEDNEQDLRWFAQASSHTGTDAFFVFFEDDSICDTKELEHQLWSQMLGMCSKNPAQHHWYPGRCSHTNHNDHIFTMNNHDLSMVFMHPFAEDPDHQFETPTMMFFPRSRTCEARESLNRVRLFLEA